MTSVQPAPFAIAPVGILRAAAWPIEKLAQFGDINLAKLAAKAAKSNADTWQMYVESYEKVFTHEREVLWQTTVEDLQFRKALLLSNSIVSGKLSGFAAGKPPQARTKTVRRLENTLYRYLARAVGRTTPNGLWAGVSLVEFAETTQVKSTTAQYCFCPDLRPFQTILRSLAQQSSYRQTAHWQINPTLTQQSDNSWYFCTRTGQGKIERHVIEQDHLVDALITELSQHKSATFAALAQSLTTSGEWGTEEELREILEALASHGVLLGGLDLPAQFTTPWEALSLASEQLHPQHRQIWEDVVSKLHCLCDRLEANIESMTLDALQQHLAAATNLVGELALALGVVIDELPNPILHCDLNLPLQVKLGEAHHHTLLQTLASYESYWLKGISPTTVFRRVQRQQIQQQLQDDVALGNITPQILGKQTWSFPPTWTQLAANGHPEITSRLEEWEALFAQEQPNLFLSQPNRYSTSSLPIAPFGCFYLSLFENFQSVAHGIDDDPARPFARFGRFLDSQSQLHTWLQTNLQNLTTKYGVKIAELQAPFEANPNVLARGQFASLPIQLWNVNQETVSLFNARISLDPITHLPFLKLPAIPEPVAVFCFCAANLSVGDAIADLLLYTGFQERPIINFPTSAIPVAAELTKQRFTPRIHLPEGGIIRPRRTVITGQPLQDMVQASPVERYVIWQELALEHGWPDWLNLQVDTEPPLLIHRDSPLALEALVKSLKTETQWLIVEELVAKPWLTDADGQHYLAELALPFCRTEHSWSLRADQDATIPLAVA